MILYDKIKGKDTPPPPDYWFSTTGTSTLRRTISPLTQKGVSSIPRVTVWATWKPRRNDSLITQMAPYFSINPCHLLACDVFLLWLCCLNGQTSVHFWSLSCFFITAHHRILKKQVSSSGGLLAGGRCHNAYALRTYVDFEIESLTFYFFLCFTFILL